MGNQKNEDRQDGSAAEIHTGCGGDSVGGNQNKVHIGGNVSGSIISAGERNTIHAGFHQTGGSLTELIQLMAQMRAFLPQAVPDSDVRAEVEHDFEVVEAQLQKDAPKKALVLPKLEDVLKLLPAAAAAGEAVQKLRPMVEQAIQWVQALLH